MPTRLQDALDRLTAAIRDVEAELAAMKAEHDPLASHIFISRRHYRNKLHRHRAGPGRPDRRHFQNRAFDSAAGDERRQIKFDHPAQLHDALIEGCGFSSTTVPVATGAKLIGPESQTFRFAFP